MASFLLYLLVRIIVPWLGVAAILYWRGREQARQLGVGNGVLVRRAAVGAAVGSVPWILPFLFGTEPALVTIPADTDGAVDEPFLARFPGALGDWGLNGLCALFAGVILIRLEHARLSPPRVLLRAPADPTVVRDGKVRDEVERIANSLGVDPPPVLLRIPSGVWQVGFNAATTDLLRQVVCVTDGALAHSSADDLRFTIAHEMAHIARRAVSWMRAYQFAIVVGAVLATAWISVWLAVAIALTALLLPVPWSHAEEHAADLRAARTVGFEQAIAAIERLELSNSLPYSPRVKRWHRATSTHPTKAQRIAHLARHTDCRVDIDHESLHAQRRVDGLVTAWLVGVGIFVAVAAVTATMQSVAIALLLVTSLAPLAIAGLAVAQSTQWAWQVSAARFPLGPVLAGLAVVIAIPIGAWLHPLSAIGLLLLVIVYLITRRFWSRRRKVLEDALHAHDPATFLVELERAPRRVQGRPWHVQWQALSYEAIGDHERALAVLASAIAKRRGGTGLRFLHALLLRYRDPQAALEEIRELLAVLPHNPYVSTAASAICRRARDLDAALELANTSVTLDPTFANARLSRVRIQVDRGDLEAAERDLARARELSPGGTSLPIAEAHLRIAQGDREGARAALDRARRAVAERPLDAQGQALAEVERMAEGLVDAAHDPSVASDGSRPVDHDQSA